MNEGYKGPSLREYLVLRCGPDHYLTNVKGGMLGLLEVLEGASRIDKPGEECAFLLVLCPSRPAATNLIYELETEVVSAMLGGMNISRDDLKLEISGLGGKYKGITFRFISERDTQPWTLNSWGRNNLYFTDGDDIPIAIRESVEKQIRAQMLKSFPQKKREKQPIIYLDDHPTAWETMAKGIMVLGIALLLFLIYFYGHMFFQEWLGIPY